MGFLGAWFAAGVGILVSLRASTVRQAYQTLNISFLLLILVPSFGIPLLPASVRGSIARTFSGVSDAALLGTVLLLLCLVDIVLMLIASRRFRAIGDYEVWKNRASKIRAVSVMAPGTIHIFDHWNLPSTEFLSITMPAN